MQEKVSIVLINYNGLKFNRPCIESVLLQTYKNFEIIFIDNASTDGSLEDIGIIFKEEIEENRIKIVKNQHNEGFSNGNNIGHKLASKDSKYICLLNNDTTLPKEWLEKLVSCIESDEELGAVASVILDHGYENHIKNNIFKNRMIYTSSIFGEDILTSFSEKEYKNNIAYCSVLSGCCLMYKKNLIETPFPDYYFAYAEDVYLSRFILKLGYKLAYCLNSLVNHYGSGSFGKAGSSLKLFHGNKNQIINFLIFYSIKDIILLLPLFTIKEISHLFLSGGGKRFLAKIKSRIRIIKNHKKITASKKGVALAAKIRDKEFISQLSCKLGDPNIFYYNFTPLQKRTIHTVNVIFKLYMKIISRVL